MAIKGGQILHVAGGPSATFVVDRIQSGGVTGVNTNEERIEELGNYEAIGTIRDIPDLTFEIESYDVTTEVESLLIGGSNAEATGSRFDPRDAIPIDILSPFKASGSYSIAGGVAVPFLTLESLSYNMSLTDPATMSVGLRGDSVFMTNGSVFYETFSGDNSTTVFNFTNGPAYKSTISGDDYYALSVQYNDGTGWKRQRLGTDFTNTNAAVTFLTAPVTGTDNIKVVYASGTATTYGTNVHNTIDPIAVRGRDISVRIGDTASPVAAQGTLTLVANPTDGDTMTVGSKTYTFEASLTDVDGNIQIGASQADTEANIVAAFDLSGTAGTDYAASMTAHPSVDISAFAAGVATLTAHTPGAGGNSIATTETFTDVGNVFDAATLGTTTAGVGGWSSWLGVQSANVDWSVSLERDEEFDNPQVISQDYDIPETTGTVTMKPLDVDALFSQIQAVMGITGTDVVNATQEPAAIQFQIRISDPSTGNTMKTLYVPDAKFNAPALQGQVGSKLETDFSFTSESGVLEVYKGDQV